MDDTKPTILAVDDKPANLRLLREILSQQGYTVRLVPNGELALATVQAELPDLILLDIMMPNLSGYEVCEQLKADEYTREVPVIFVSAQSETIDKLKAFEVGGVDYVTKPFQAEEVIARIETHLKIRSLQKQLQTSNQALQEANTALELRNHFIRKTFGRYVSNEIVDTILESPSGLSLGGERRVVTILMADLRGFTNLAERLPAETTIEMLNNYLDTMTDIIFKYRGTINEFIGDAIVAVFGAPISYNDDAKRAVACALEMQLAMTTVNQSNHMTKYPLAMGIGINTGEVIVGNIGSYKRTKYDIVGHNVNLSSRIESYAVGGQVLISETTLKACDFLLTVGSRIGITPKGIKGIINIYAVCGIGGEYGIVLPQEEIQLFELQQPLTIQFSIVEDKRLVSNSYTGKITKLSKNSAEICAQRSCRELTNLKISITDESEMPILGDIYAKVTEKISAPEPTFRVYFTFVPLENEIFFKQLLKTE